MNETALEIILNKRRYVFFSTGWSDQSTSLKKLKQKSCLPINACFKIILPILKHHFTSHFKSIEKNLKNQQKKHVPGLPSCSWNSGNFSKATEAMASQKGTSRLAQVARPARKMVSTRRYNEILLDRIDNTQYVFNNKSKQNKTKREREREIYIYITRVVIYIGDMTRYRRKYFLYTVYNNNNNQIGGKMEYRYHKISCCGHNGVWTGIQRDMDITKMNKIPQNCRENWWCQMESVYQEASDSPRLNQERHGCDLRHTELSTSDGQVDRETCWYRGM